MLVCFGPATRASLLGGGVGRRVGLAVSYAAFVLACLALSSATLSHAEHPSPTVGLGAAEKLAIGPSRHFLLTHGRSPRVLTAAPHAVP
jgi:hypothetical protein